MGEKIMMKNIIIIGLLVIIMTGATASDVVAYIENNQLIDKFSEMLYSIVRSVKNV
jgi:HJR/Mrr/RecB family endonuclease